MKKLIYLLIGALGFTACSENGDNDGGGGGGAMCEYGTPTVHFAVKGRVTDADGNPIKGIVISSTGVGDVGVDKTLEAVSAEDGSFATERIKAFSVYGKLTFTDTDGAENGGEFETKTVELHTLPKTQITEGDGSWYSGDYEVTADVKLKAK